MISHRPDGQSNFNGDDETQHKQIDLSEFDVALSQLEKAANAVAKTGRASLKQKTAAFKQADLVKLAQPMLSKQA